jgi:phosphoribosylpyrophosphate synthetase
VCLAVHALFPPETAAALRAAGASGIVTTNTINHPASAIDIVPLLVPAVADLAGALTP